MFKSRQSIVFVLALGVIIVAAGMAVSGWAQAAPATPTAQTADRTNAPPLDPVKYADLFVKAFEGQLSIDDVQLNAAFTGAVSDTVDQAVKDGVVTSDQAAQAKTFVKDGVTGLLTAMRNFASKFGSYAYHAEAGKPAIQALNPASLAAALGLSSSELEIELKSGKSIADIAQEHHVDLQKMKDTVLANVKSELDSAVKGGQLTRSQADLAYQALSQKMTNMVSATTPQGRPAGKSMRMIDVVKYANLFLNAFESRLNIDDARLDAAVAAAASATLEQAVKDGVITSDQAAQANTLAKMGVRQLASFANKGFFGPFSFAGHSARFSDNIDRFMSKPISGPR